jgi:CDP-paratose 2-epimerase
VITGGAGFVGTNLAHRLLEEGRRVLVLDDLSRPGADQNLAWLEETHGRRLEACIAEVGDGDALQDVLVGAEAVVHLAAQVAVTTSLEAPLHDFAHNLQTTLTLLEALRQAARPVPLLYTSTNKVYGALPDVALRRTGRRWQPVDRRLRDHGISERRPLAFCTPYGCSKGGADQYVLDYAKTFGLPAVVFRMSCIYGEHQHGTEDQGWVAHFLIRALAGERLVVYGDGCQVRDVLFATDLVEAMLRVLANASHLAGTAFNVGGGPGNTLSLLELLAILEDLGCPPAEVEFAEERPGDQRWYVSDTSQLERRTGWRPMVDVDAGIRALHTWLVRSQQPLAAGARAA